MNERPESSVGAVLPVRVELGSDRVRILVPGFAPVDLGGDLLGALFARGLSLSPDAGTDEAEQSVVDGPTRFLVGEFDVGRAAGMSAVRAALMEALAATLVTLTGTPVEVAITASDDPELSGPDRDGLPPVDVDARRRAALAHARNMRTPDVYVDVADFEMTFDRYFALIADRGIRLTLTRNGQPVIEAVPFEMARAEHEARAWVSLAYWTSWKGGVFDSSIHARMVDELMAMPEEPAHPVGDPIAGQREAPKPGRAGATGPGEDSSDAIT